MSQILNEEAISWALILLQIRCFAKQIYKFSRDSNPLSQGQVYYFISYYNYIKTKLFRSLETKRAKGIIKK